MSLRSRTHTAMHCPLPPYAMDGDVWECDDCGRMWRYRSFPNAEHARWRRLWPDLVAWALWRRWRQ